MIHLAGNASLLLFGYYWLGLGESDSMHLALSAAVLLIFALAATWLHATALVMFRPDEGLRLPGAALRTLRHLLPLFFLSVLVLLVYLALAYFYDSFGHEAFTIGSFGTMKLRRPVEPNNVLQAFHFFIWLLRWFVVPVMTLPLASEIANRGWPGFNLVAFKRSRNVLFWIQAGLLTVAAVHLPLHLFLWVPKMSSFSMEVISVMARLGLAYLLFTAGLLALEFVTSAGMPPVTQPSTVGSP
jgi:hypothetical protein